MKIGYPDTINNKAYQGEKSPFKMVDKSKADLDKDGKVSDYEENRAEAAFGDAPLNYSPVKAVSPSRAKLIAANKAAAEKAKKAEAAIRESESSSKSSEPTAEPARKKTRLGRAVGGIRKAIKARKERRNDGVDSNPKVQEREIGRITRKKNKKENKDAIKKQKSLVTKARQDEKTAKAVTKQTKRLKKVTNKVAGKVADVKSGGLGIDQAPRNKRKAIAANKVTQKAYNKKKAEDKKKKSFKGF